MNLLSNILYRESSYFSYSYFENYDDDCNCMWRKDPDIENVYEIARVDIIPEFRRNGFARDLIKDAIKRIETECPKACVEITAKLYEDNGVTVENLVDFYKSLGFEEYQSLGSRVHLRLYLDDSVKPHTVKDNPFHFK